MTAGGGHAMLLSNLRKQVKEFAQRAEECARQADTAPSAVREHYQQLEKHWLLLAQHYFLTLEEAERSYRLQVNRNESAGAPSVFEK
jgi:erythromycin esterase-like protein